MANGTVVATGSNSYGQCEFPIGRTSSPLKQAVILPWALLPTVPSISQAHGSTTYVPRGMSEICRLAEEVETDEDITSDSEGDITSSEISSSVEN